MISRAWLVLALFLNVPALLHAQKQVGQWSDLKGLKAGQSIEVVESSLKRHGGEFVSVTDNELTLRERNSDFSLKREDVVRVSTGSGARRGEHAVVGVLVGGAIGDALPLAYASAATIPNT